MTILTGFCVLLILVANRLAIYREIQTLEKNMEFRNDLFYRQFIEESENSNE